MAQFTAIVKFSQMFTVAMQRELLEKAFSTNALPWCSSITILKEKDGRYLCLDKIKSQKVKTPVDALMLGGVVDLTDTFTNESYRFAASHLQDGIEWFCNDNHFHPCVFATNVSSEMINHVIQYAVFGKIQYP